MTEHYEIVLDIRGQVCPSSLLITLRGINEHRTAISNRELVLKVMTDSRDAIITIPNAVRNMGFVSEFEKMHEGYYTLSITRGLET